MFVGVNSPDPILQRPQLPVPTARAEIRTVGDQLATQAEERIAQFDPIRYLNGHFHPPWRRLKFGPSFFLDLKRDGNAYRKAKSRPGWGGENRFAFPHRKVLISMAFEVSSGRFKAGGLSFPATRREENLPSFPSIFPLVRKWGINPHQGDEWPP
jgi:hypothetical protein